MENLFAPSWPESEKVILPGHIPLIRKPPSGLILADRLIMYIKSFERLSAEMVSDGSLARTARSYAPSIMTTPLIVAPRRALTSTPLTSLPSTLIGVGSVKLSPPDLPPYSEYSPGGSEI